MCVFAAGAVRRQCSQGIVCWDQTRRQRGWSWLHSLKNSPGR